MVVYVEDELRKNRIRGWKRKAESRQEFLLMEDQAQLGL